MRVIVVAGICTMFGSSSNAPSGKGIGGKYDSGKSEYRDEGKSGSGDGSSDGPCGGVMVIVFGAGGDGEASIVPLGFGGL